MVHPGTPGPNPEADAFVAAFARWAAEGRAGAAAAARSRERWLRQQEAEAATLAGTLVDLAEAQADATLLVGTRHVTGRLVGVGRDSCVVAEGGGRTTIVALAHLTAVRLAGQRRGSGEATGDRDPAGDWGLVDALGALVAERSPVRVGMSGGEMVTGELIAAGEDVVTIRIPGGGMRVHLAVARIETCSPH